jgi:hypothetical protein
MPVAFFAATGLLILWALAGSAVALIAGGFVRAGER